MSLIIHATITVRGEAADLAACRERIRRALDAQALEGEADERHGADALCYDLKLSGGIPFPAFVDVSAAFPQVVIEVAWVNAEAAQRGAATISGGKLERNDIDALAGQARAPVCVRMAPDGRLALACAVMRLGPDECRGYAIEGNRDAVFRAVRLPGGAMELYATEGAAEWVACWRVEPGAAAFAREGLEPAQPIAEAEFSVLQRMALDFAAEWVWFAQDPERDVVVERERLKRRGHVEHAANLRSVALARVDQGGVRKSGVLVYDTLTGDLRWVEQLLTRCWVSDS